MGRNMINAVVKDVKMGKTTIEHEIDIRCHEMNVLNNMISNRIRTIESNNRRIAAIYEEVKELKRLKV